MDPVIVAAILGSGGLAVLIPQIITGVKGMLDGHHDREKHENVDALSQRDRAIRERDRADACRRVMQEYASTLRRILIEHGLGNVTPPWPTEKRDGFHPPLRDRDTDKE